MTINVFAGPILSAITPNKIETIPNNIFSDNETKDPSVARSLWVNSFCWREFNATSPVPKVRDVEPISTGEAIVGNSNAIIFTILFEIISN